MHRYMAMTCSKVHAMVYPIIDTLVISFLAKTYIYMQNGDNIWTFRKPPMMMNMSNNAQAWWISLNTASSLQNFLKFMILPPEMGFLKKLDDNPVEMNQETRPWSPDTAADSILFQISNSKVQGWNRTEFSELLRIFLRADWIEHEIIHPKLQFWIRFRQPDALPL